MSTVRRTRKGQSFELSELALVYYGRDKAKIAAMKARIEEAGRANAWNVSDTADSMGYNERTFYRWIEKYGLFAKFASERSKLSKHEASPVAKVA